MMDNSSRWTTLLILVAVCGSIYLLTMGLFKHEKPLYLGISFKNTPTNDSLTKFSEDQKLNPQLVAFNIQWPTDTQNHAQFPLESLKMIGQKGLVPCIHWMTNLEERTLNLIQKGEVDSYLKNVSDSIKTLNFPLLICFAPHMNVQTLIGEGQVEQKTFLAERYKETYRYIIQFFRQQKVTNVLWVFSPHVESIPNVEGNKASKYYPGNEYIDVLGMDGYPMSNPNPSQTISNWKGFDTIFGSLYKELKSLAPGKPILVFETANKQRGQTDPREWIIQALDTCKAWEISAYVWSNTDQDNRLRIILLDKTVQGYFTEQPPMQEWIKKLQK